MIIAYSLAPFEWGWYTTQTRTSATAAPDVLSQLIGAPDDMRRHVLAFGIFGFLVATAGAATSPRAAAKAAIRLAVPLALVIEALQLVLPGRHSQVADLVVNILSGAVGGWIAWPARGAMAAVCAYASRCAVVLRRSVLWGTSVLWIVLLVLPAVFGVSLDSWRLEFPLLVGNEVGGERPWLGSVRYVALYDRALDGNEVSGCFGAARKPSDEALATRPDSPASWYEPVAGPVVGFAPSGRLSVPPIVAANPSACRVLDEPRRLTILKPTIMSTGVPPRELTQAIRRANEFSLEVVFASSSLDQRGPARIVSLSNGLFDRNVTLGQEFGSLVFRVRTPITGASGASPALIVHDAIVSDRDTHVVATYADGVSRLYVDGALAATPLDLHAPPVVLQLGRAPVSHFMAAMLMTFPFVAVWPLGRFVSFDRTVGGVIALGMGLLGIGWLIRALVADHEPDYATALWVSIAVVANAMLIAGLRGAMNGRRSASFRRVPRTTSVSCLERTDVPDA